MTNDRPTTRTGDKARLLVSTGHTGGHFFPAASFAETFLNTYPEAEVHILVSKLPSFAQKYALNSRFRLHVINFSQFPSFFSLKMIPFLLEYVRAFWKTFILLLKIKPKAVIGFGSFGSVPGVLCARLLGIPVLLHEQNRVAGKANQFLAYFAERIAVSFSETEGIPAHKAVWTGFPLRQGFLNGTQTDLKPKTGAQSLVILVLGGSQGARALNGAILQFFQSLNTEERSIYAVIHITGSEDLGSVKKSYSELGIKAEIFDFSDRIAEYYRKASFVISRSGAGTVFELAALGKAAILVPYPFARGHQKQNAEALSCQNAALLIEEKDLSVEKLRDAINRLRIESERQLFEKNIKQFANREAGELLAENTWSLMCKKN